MASIAIFHGAVAPFWVPFDLSIELNSQKVSNNP